MGQLPPGLDSNSASDPWLEVCTCRKVGILTGTLAGIDHFQGAGMGCDRACGMGLGDVSPNTVSSTPDYLPKG